MAEKPVCITRVCFNENKNKEWMNERNDIIIMNKKDKKKTHGKEFGWIFITLWSEVYIKNKTIILIINMKMVIHLLL